MPVPALARPRPRAALAVAAVLALTVLLGLVGTSGAGASAHRSEAGGAGAAGTAHGLVTSPGTERAPTAAAGTEPAVGTDPGAPLVVIGVAGLSWSDVGASTPALAELAQGAIGSLVVRSVYPTTCPVDGWLALNSGSRAADARGPCRSLAEPVSGELTDWPDVAAEVAEQSYDARLGLLRSVLEAGGIQATAIGPGAAIALADANGAVSDYQVLADAEDLADQAAAAVSGSDLVVIDVGTIVDPDTVAEPEDAGDLTRPDVLSRTDQVRLVDADLQQILTGLRAAGPTGELPTVLLAGLADSGESGLRAVAVAGGGTPAGLLSSSSTRQPGYVMATDLFTTVVEHFDLSDAVPPGAAMGAPLLLQVGPAEDGGARLDQVIDADAHAQAVRPIVPAYFLLLVLVNLALFATVTLVLKRSTANRIGAALSRRFGQRRGVEWLRQRLNRPVPALHTLRTVALGIGALPISSFLANLLPWWRVHPPVLALAVLILAIDALIVTLALLGPWRRHTFGPAAFVAAVTAVTLAVDVVTGATMQISAVMGISALVGARFYGMNNTTFALLAIASLMVTMVVANPLVLAGRRRLAAVVVLVIALVVTALDGAPAFGADFGGPPALLAAFGVLALLALGVRLTWQRVLAVVVVAGLASVALAFVDWLRPPDERTHLGRFFQTVLDGGLWDVIWRKLDQNISIVFGNRPLTILAICGVLTVVYVLARPIRAAITTPGGGEFAWLSAGNPISMMARDAPMLRPGLVAMAVALGVGLAINDSGIAIAAIGVSLGVPLLIAATTTWMLSLRDLPAAAVDADGAERSTGQVESRR